MAVHLIEINHANFEDEVLASEVPVLVDFWAQWCPPCRIVSPIVEELASEYAGRAKIANCDCDTSRELAVSLNITAIPTLMVFNGGEVVHRFIGVTSKEELAGALDAALG